MKKAIEVLHTLSGKGTGPPGAIATDFSGGIVRDKLCLNKRVADMTALGWVGLPDDIGPMIASLLLRRQPLDQRSAHRSIGRNVHLAKGQGRAAVCLLPANSAII